MQIPRRIVTIVLGIGYVLSEMQVNTGLCYVGKVLNNCIFRCACSGLFELK